MPRIARIVGIGYPHHIIQRGNNRQPVFFDDEDRQFYLRLLKNYSSECDCNLKAYCLMSNHVHMLAVPQYDYSLAKTMQKLSLSFTQYINKKYKRTGRLWECRFHSCLVDRESYLLVVCRYIERNPVRAKIVSEPTQYKWSSARVNVGLEQQYNFIEPIWRGYLTREEYIKFLNQSDKEDEIEHIRKSTFTGRPMGADKFLKDIAETLGVVLIQRPRGRPSKIGK